MLLLLLPRPPWRLRSLLLPLLLLRSFLPPSSLEDEEESEEEEELEEDEELEEGDRETRPGPTGVDGRKTSHDGSCLAGVDDRWGTRRF